MIHAPLILASVLMTAWSNSILAGRLLGGSRGTLGAARVIGWADTAQAGVGYTVFTAFALAASLHLYDASFVPARLLHLLSHMSVVTALAGSALSIASAVMLRRNGTGVIPRQGGIWDGFVILTAPVWMPIEAMGDMGPFMFLGDVEELFLVFLALSVVAILVGGGFLMAYSIMNQMADRTAGERTASS